MLSWLVSAVIGHAAPSNLPIEVNGHLVHPRRLIVEMTGPSAAQSIRSLGAKIVRRLPQIDRVVIEVATDKLVGVQKMLTSKRGIGRVDWDGAAKLAYTPNDPYWGNQWHLRDIKVDTAWDLSLGSSEILVAVIDTGIDASHPDLVGNLWDNVDEIANNGVDDDSDGLIDNKHGYDFAYDDGTPEDVYGHGTPCAGIVAAVGDNGIGISGIAPRAKVVALKTCVNEGYLYDSNNIPAYLWAADNGVKVFSMSYFTDYDVTSAGGAAFDYVISKGVLPCAAAGNDAQIWNYYPGGYEGVVAVAATDGGTSKAGFSNYGSWVDLAAPGSGLISTGVGGGYTGFGGTSGACPHIAGVAALIWGANPSLTAAQVRAAMEDTATAVNQWPYGEFCNYGVVNARLAMEVALGASNPGKSPLVRYVTPCAAATKPSASVLQGQLARIHGRGFQSPRVVEVRWNGISLPIVLQTRDYVDIRLPRLRKLAAPDNLIVKVDGQVVQTLDLPGDRRTIYSATEVSSAGATATGNFFEMLADDELAAVGYNRGDGSIYVQSQFRKVLNGPNMSLLYRREYTGSGGSEAVYLYDWTANSLPYGNWVQVYNGSASTSSTFTEIPVPNFSRFIDPEGSVYLYVYAQGVGSNGQLKVDQLNLASGN